MASGGIQLATGGGGNSLGQGSEQSARGLGGSAEVFAEEGVEGAMAIWISRVVGSALASAADIVKGPS